MECSIAGGSDGEQLEHRSLSPDREPDRNPLSRDQGRVRLRRRIPKALCLGGWNYSTRTTSCQSNELSTRPACWSSALARSPPVDVWANDVAIDTEAGQLGVAICLLRSSECSSSTGMSTWRERRYSPRPLACGSGRVEAATPRPSRPTTTKFSARRFGSSYRRTSRSAASGSSMRNLATSRYSCSQPYDAWSRVHRPTFALPPLSPDRAPQTSPSGARRVGPVGSACTVGPVAADDVMDCESPPPDGCGSPAAELGVHGGMVRRGSSGGASQGWGPGGGAEGGPGKPGALPPG